MIRVGNIKYKNKIFTIFYENKYYFLESISNKYNCCDLNDYSNLTNIFNKQFDGIVYLNKKKKIEIGIGIVYICSLSLLLPRVKLQLENLYTNQKIKWEVEREIDSNDYLISGSLVQIFDKETMDKYLPKNNPNREELLNILKQNKDISDPYRIYIDNYINRIMDVYPKMDYRVFASNLKKLKIEKISKKEMIKDRSKYTEAYFDSNETTIVLSSSLENEVDAFDHELTHTINIMQIPMENYNIVKNFYNIEQGYGRALNEGMTANINNQLFNDPSYSNQRFFIKLLEEILGEDQLIELYSKQNINDLEQSLVNLGNDREKIVKFITLLDTDLKSCYKDIKLDKESFKEMFDLSFDFYKNYLKDKKEEDKKFEIEMFKDNLNIIETDMITKVDIINNYDKKFNIINKIK